MIKSSNSGPFVIPTAPSAGTAVAQSGSANTLGTAVQMIASTAEADYIVGVTFEATTVQVPTYLCFQITTGVSTVVATVTIPIPFTAGAAATQIGLQYDFPFPIPVATATKISIATASSAASAISWNTWLRVHKQADLIDAGVKEQADVQTWLTTAVTAATAGIPDTNVKNMNNVAATSITTINANQGTTQPVNFSGTGAAAYVNSFTAGATPAWDSAIRRATAQAGAAGSITLDAGASAVDSIYNWEIIMITVGTGIGQTRLITGYTGSTKVATVSPNWTTNPDATSIFGIMPAGRSNIGAWLETAVTAATAGIPDANVKNINNVAAATPGASGGMLISGSNSGTTTLGALTITGATTYTGNVVLSDGLTISAPSTLNRAGLDIAGNGTGAGLKITGGATGIGLSVIGGGTSGDGIKVTTTSGHGLNLAPVGTSMHGLFATGGNGGTSDGIKAAAGTGGVDLRANQTGNLTGNVSGSVGSVTGAVGSVAAGVTVTTNNDKTGYTLTVTPPTAATIATTIWQDLMAGADFGTAASIGALLKADIDTTISSRLATSGYTAPSNLTAAQIATGVWTDTTAGDFTAGLSIGKSIMNGVSLGTGLTIAAVSGAVGSVTGSVGSVAGAVGSVTSGVTVTTNNDKTGYALTAAYDLSKTASQAGDAMTLTAAYNAAKTAAQAGDAMSLTAAYDFAKGTVAITESYAADGAAPTPAQSLMLIQQALTEFTISGTAWTIKKLDGSTTAATLTLDDATSPTGVTRSG